MAAEFDNRLPSDQLYQDPTRWVDLDAGDEARDPNNKFFLLTLVLLAAEQFVNPRERELTPGERSAW